MLHLRVEDVIPAERSTPAASISACSAMRCLRFSARSPAPRCHQPPPRQTLYPTVAATKIHTAAGTRAISSSQGCQDSGVCTGAPFDGSNGT